MREIKFRGQRIDGEGWTYGYYMENHMNKAYQINFSINKEVIYQIYPKGCDVSPREIIPETVGQYTGLEDKNGVEIYEGDILGLPQHKPENWSGDVYFKEGAFFITPNGAESLLNNYRAGRSIVIGNIHCNPELLK